MAKPYFYRWTDEQAEAVEAHRVRLGVKSTKEALDALILAGLERPTVSMRVDPAVGANLTRPTAHAVPTGSIKQAARQIKAERGEDSAAVSVPYAGNVQRRATPKPTKGKR